MSALLSADVENIQWVPAPHHNLVLISTEDGHIYWYAHIHSVLMGKL